MLGTFAEKLDFLMKLTNTPNSVLGRALSFDASYISRIRNGKRGVPKHQPFIAPAAAFFARNLVEPYQQAAVCEAVPYSSEWPQDPTLSAAVIETWLSAPDGLAVPSADPVGSFLVKLAASSKAESPDIQVRPEDAQVDNRIFYYGNEGKRCAVRSFLRELIATGEPQTLLLHSDEDMGWLTENAAFLREWSLLLVKLISQGGRIKIIHMVNRDIGDMLEALRQWVPLYMSGAIEPFYCPKVRDRVYHRTLFIAKGHSAIVASSVGSATQGMANAFVRDAQTVAAFEAEFAEYLKLCKPLMRIFLPREHDSLVAVSRRFSAVSTPVRFMEGFEDIAEGSIAVIANEEAGVLVFHRGEPRVAFHIIQQAMLESFWEYLGRIDQQSQDSGIDAGTLLDACLSEMQS